MTNIDFQVLESRCTLTRGSTEIVHETWFITRKGLLRSLPPIRRDIYKLDDGSVVAVCDSGIGADTSLYMDAEFMMLYADEPELGVIMSDQGIADINKIKTFRMED